MKFIQVIELDSGYLINVNPSPGTSITNCFSWHGISLPNVGVSVAKTSRRTSKGFDNLHKTLEVVSGKAAIH